MGSAPLFPSLGLVTGEPQVPESPVLPPNLPRHREEVEGDQGRARAAGVSMKEVRTSDAQKVSNLPANYENFLLRLERLLPCCSVRALQRSISNTVQGEEETSPKERACGIMGASTANSTGPAGRS